MQIILHTGVHFTEEERLIKCIIRNREDFAKRGVGVPDPERYRKLIRDAVVAIGKTQPAPGARDVLLDAILEDDVSDRIILSLPHFFGVPRYCLRNGWLYHSAASRMATISALFPNDEVELFMGIRNPATFLPKVYEKTPVSGFDAFFGASDPAQLRWSDTFKAIRTAAPKVSITTWCYEDAPILWPQIVREIAALEHGQRIMGGFDLLSRIMRPEGMKRFRDYLKSHPDMPEIHKRRVMMAFLDKFADESAIEEEIDMPGWTEELIDDLSEIYEEDIFEIQRIPGVTMIAP